jgi:hypothetical protein
MSGRDWNAAQRAERAAGLAYARAWRIRKRAEFDALFGPEAVCPRCGRASGVVQ